MYTKSLVRSIFSETRSKVLRELVLSGEKKIHLRELSRRTGLNLMGVQRELKNLLAAGIVLEERSGNQKLYTLNRKSPIYDELKMIIVKTAGVADEVRKALEPLKDKIYKAFIYGSFATGTYDSESDIDLAVIGDISLKDIVGATSGTSKMLRRVLNAVTFSRKEYNEKLKEDGFVRRIETGEKIVLIGESDES
jgi:predicted nucleotidyltransferase